MDIDFKWLLRQQTEWSRADTVCSKDTTVYVSSGKRHDGWYWGRRSDLDTLHESRYCVVWWADNTIELLSRDEEECRLFATLWELSK